MAKRGPIRPKSAPLAHDTVSILNGEVPPGSSLMPSPKKRKRETGDGSPTAKRKAANQSAQAGPEARRSTRLSHPRVTTRQQRAAGDSGQMQSREIYEVPPADPSHSSRTTGARKRAAKAKAGENEDDNASPVEDGEQGAANPLMTSPSANTRNYARRGGMVKQDEDPEDRDVDVQPVKKGQRHQRALTNGLTTRSNVLLKPQSTSSGTMEQSSAPQHALEEQAAAVAVTSAREEVIQGTQASTNAMPQDQQDRTAAPEESVDTVETRSTDGQQHETSHVANTGEGLEEAFRLHDCEKSWDTMRNAARENLNNDDRDNQALEIRELVGLIKKARAVYRAIRNGGEGGTDDQECKIGEHLVDIKERIRTIRPTHDTKKDSRLAKDVYVQGIPKMVTLLKMVLVTRALHGELSISSLKELVTIIDATLSLCDKACRWQPRPTLEYGVKRRTRTEILPSLEALRTAYMEAQYEGLDDEDKEAEAAEEAQKAAKRQALADHVAKFLAEEEEKRRCAEHNNRAVTPDRHQRSINRPNSAADFFEIDNLGLDDTTPAAAPNGARRSLPWKETGEAAARQALPSVLSQACATGDVARRSRERTEDIPGPMAPDWSRREDGQLLYGLELFRGANRYLEIDRHFGSAGGPLSGRDVDELMQRAKFLKHSLASHIEEEREQVGKVDHWAFLLSVEG